MEKIELENEFEKAKLKLLMMVGTKKKGNRI